MINIGLASFNAVMTGPRVGRVVVLLLVVVSAVVMLMYLHLAREVCHLRNYIEAHAATEIKADTTLPELKNERINGASAGGGQVVVGGGGRGKGGKGVEGGGGRGGGGKGKSNARSFSIENMVVIYNRIPKTGSTSFIGLAYDLCNRNKFSVINVNTTKKIPTLSLTDQMRFVQNVSSWENRKPGIYHGHIAYLNFNRFGASVEPLYINILRQPLDRLISHYYFIRYGDDFRPQRVYKKMGDTMTLDECVSLQHPDCSSTHLWMQVPFFCGHHAECWVPGSAWALEEAKRNLVHNYLLVGVTEELEAFVALLEYTLPRFFRGALDLYVSGSKSHIRKTTKKIMPTEETVAKLQSTKVWKLENEFYNFALDHFHFMQKKTLMEAEDGSGLVDRGQNFIYGKIKPKKRWGGTEGRRKTKVTAKRTPEDDQSEH